MTESVYEKIARDSFSLEDISHALAESQFSLGAKNRIETLLKIACPSENTPEPEIIRDFSSLFEVWMSTIDASKAIVNH